MSTRALSMTDFESNASQVAKLMKALGNEKRLMILCKLMIEKELSVQPLADKVGLSQSALSQHLAKLRNDKIVDFRRDGQTLHYHISDTNVLHILKKLKTIFC